MGKVIGKRITTGAVQFLHKVLSKRGIFRACAAISTLRTSDSSSTVYHDNTGTLAFDMAPGVDERAVKAQANRERNQAGASTNLEANEEKVSRIRGVRINCPGDRKVCRAPPFEEVMLPSTHPIFQGTNTLDSPDTRSCIETPLLTLKEPPHIAWASVKDPTRFGGRNPFDNDSAALLRLSFRYHAATGRSWGKVRQSY